MGNVGDGLGALAESWAKCGHRLGWLFAADVRAGLHPALGDRALAGLLLGDVANEA